MNLYTGGLEDDLDLFEWYGKLMETGEFWKVFSALDAPLSRFMAAMQEPTIFLYERDDEGVWFASWYRPFYSVVRQGLWARKDKRGVDLVPVVGESMRIVLASVPLITGFTRQEKVAQSAEMFGAKRHGQVPGIWDGEPAHFISLQREDFKNGGNYGRR